MLHPESSIKAPLVRMSSMFNPVSVEEMKHIRRVSIQQDGSCLQAFS